MSMADRVRANIRREMKLRGITQKYVAAYLGISQGSVSQFLNAAGPVQTNKIEDYAAALGIDPTQLVEDQARQLA